MISGVVLGLFTPTLKLDNRLSRSSWWLLFAVCPENILHGRKTRDMLLLAHFVGDEVSVTRLVCRLVCKISGGIRFSGKKRSCMVTFQANVLGHVWGCIRANIDKRNILRFLRNFIKINISNCLKYLLILYTTLNLIFWRDTKHERNTTRSFSNTFERNRTFPKFQAMHQASILGNPRDSILPSSPFSYLAGSRPIAWRRFHKSINWNVFGRLKNQRYGWSERDTSARPTRYRILRAAKSNRPRINCISITPN